MKIIDQYKEDKWHKTIFENGLTLVNECVTDMNSFSLGFCVKAGSEDDTIHGTAHFMEHMAFKRTKNRNASEIANEFEDIGAYSNAWTTKEHTCFYVRAIKEHFEKCFELLSDITLNTIFTEQEMEKERAVIIEEIKSYEDDPEEYILDMADSVVFNNSFLAHPIAGTEKDVLKIKIAHLQDFHKNYYHPSNIVVAIAGNISNDTAIKLCQKYLESEHKKVKENFPDVEGESLSLIKKKHIQQNHILLGKLTQGMLSQERYPLALANIIFGEGMSSRLYQNIREQKGIAYSIYSNIQQYKKLGILAIYAATQVNMEQCLNLINEEMQKFITTNPPTALELNRAKEQLKSATIIELESMSSRMQNLLKQEVYFEKYESPLSTSQKIDAFKIEEVIEVANKYFNVLNWHKCALLQKKQS